jgi:hypothetical protein
MIIASKKRGRIASFFLLGGSDVHIVTIGIDNLSIAFGYMRF